MIKTIIFALVFIAFLYIMYKVYKSICANIDFDEGNNDNESQNIIEQIDAYKNAGQLQDAFNIAKSNLSKNPKSEMARFLYAKLLFDAEKYYDAIGQLNLILRGNPNNSEATLLIGDSYNKTKQYSKAITTYKYVVERDKTNIKALAKLADLYIFRKDKKSAVQIYKKLIELSQDEGEKKGFRLILANLYFELRDWDSLIEEANLIMEAYPNDKSILFYLKKAYLICDKYTDAIDITKRLIEIDPYNVKHYEDLINLSFKTKEYDNIIEYCNELGKMRNANKAFVNNCIAKAYMQKKEYSKAIEYINEVSRASTRDPDLKKTMADVYCLMDNFDEAITLYEEVIEDAHPREVEDLMSEMSDIYFRQGNKFMEEGEFTQAFEKYNKAIEYNPANSEFFFALGEMNARIKNHTEAIKNYKSAIELEPNISEYYMKLAAVYYELENILDAKKCYNEAILIKPDSVIAHATLGLLYAKQQETENAISSFKKALEIEPLNVDIRYNLALSYEHSMNREKAMKEYKKVLEIDPEHIESKNNLEILLKFT